MKTMLLAAAAMAALGPMSAVERRQGRFMRAPDGHPPATAPLAALRAQRNSLVAEMGTMIAAAEKENRDFTAEETSDYDAKKAQLDAIDVRLGRLTSQAAAEAVSETIVPAAARGGGLSIPEGPHGKKEFESLGEFMHAVRFRPTDARLNFVEGVGAAADGEIGAEMRMDNDTQGGFMVPTEFRGTILQVKPQDALVRPRANVLPAGSNPDAAVGLPVLNQQGSAPSNMFGGIQVVWTGEGQEMTETDAELSDVTLTPHEVSGFATVTDKLLRNWQSAGPFLETLFRGAVAAAEDFAFLRGSGVHRPLGVLNAGATKFVNRLNANQIGYKDLTAMLAVLLMRGGSPVWSIPQGALPQIAGLKDDANNLIWAANARDGFAGDLLGFPVRWNNRAPALGTKGDVLLADWSQYLIKDGAGPFVATSEHVKFTSNKTLIKIVWNVDGAPWLNGPVEEENGHEVSPFVALDVPA